jgi:hypothetical protein
MDLFVCEPTSSGISEDDAADCLENIAATSGTVAPAAALTAVGAQLFQWETLQLTQPVLANLTNMNLTDVALFRFPTASSASTSQCKVFPGDANWPSPVAWKVLNLLTGDALIQSVPLAAPCYNGWPEYNASACASITSQWSDPHLQ